MNVIYPYRGFNNAFLAEFLGSNLDLDDQDQVSRYKQRFANYAQETEDLLNVVVKNAGTLGEIKNPQQVLRVLAHKNKNRNQEKKKRVKDEKRLAEKQAKQANEKRLAEERRKRLAALEERLGLKQEFISTDAFNDGQELEMLTEADSQELTNSEPLLK